MRILKRWSTLHGIFCMLSVHVVVSHDDMRCLDPQNRRGVCVPFEDCPHLMAKNVENLRNDTIEFFDECARICANKKRGGKELFCCRKRDYHCGEPDGNRIANGENSRLLEFIWVVRLLYSDGLGGHESVCSGSLIDAKNVITAAHCVNPKRKPTHVLVGDYDTATIEDCETVKNRKTCAEPPQRIRIQKIRRHHKFEQARGSNDIAVIHLARPVNLHTSNVQPICLPTKNLTQPANLIITGWGRMEKGSPAHILQKADIEIMSRTDCERELKIQVHNNIICGSKARGIGTCEGDSGGPVIGLTKIGKKELYFQYGIIHGGSKLCDAKTPSTFTNVIQYIDWINKHMKK